MKKILVLIFLLYSSTTFAQKEVIEYLINNKIVKQDTIRYFFYDGIRKYKLDKRNRVIGDVVEYHQNGKTITSRYHYKNGIIGKIDGDLIKYCCLEGDTGTITHYVNGKMDGESSTYFYFNDVRKEKYKTNRVITSKTFYRKGKPLKSFSFMNDDTTGITLWKYGIRKQVRTYYYFPNNFKEVETTKRHRRYIIKYYTDGNTYESTKNGIQDGVQYSTRISNVSTYEHYKNGILHGTSIWLDGENKYWKKFDHGYLIQARYTDSSNNLFYSKDKISKGYYCERYFKKGRTLASSTMKLIRHNKYYLKTDTVFYKNGEIHFINQSMGNANEFDTRMKNREMRYNKFRLFSTSIYDSKGNFVLLLDTFCVAKIYREKDVNGYMYYGLETYDGKKITGPDYVYIWTSGNKNFMVNQGGIYCCWGIIDGKGKVVQPIQYKELKVLDYGLPKNLFMQFDSSVFEIPDSSVWGITHYSDEHSLNFLHNIPLGFADSAKHAEMFDAGKMIGYTFIADSTSGLMDYQGKICFQDKNLWQIFPLGEGYFGLRFMDYTMGLAHFTRGIITRNIKSLNSSNSLNSAKKNGKLIFNFSNSQVDLWYDEDGNRVEYKK